MSLTPAHLDPGPTADPEAAAGQPRCPSAEPPVQECQKTVEKLNF
jgi:hypothetical protein